MSDGPAIFLDRDNTIIANDGDLGDPSGVVLLEGAADALSRLHHAGWPLIVITNQGGVARGRYTEDDVRAVHAQVQNLLGATPILDWLWCPFHPQGSVPAYAREHPWRKPAPGMLLEAACRHGLLLKQSWLIGDQDRDIAAGLAAGCQTVLLAESAGTPPPTFVASSIGEAADTILAETNRD